MTGTQVAVAGPRVGERPAVGMFGLRGSGNIGNDA